MPSSPFVIHAVAVDSAEQIVTRRQPLLVQPVTSMRAVRLDAETPAAISSARERSFPAGTLAFGVYVRDGWAYCAIAESRLRLWSPDQYVCYIDSDNDGRFESAIDSGEPFGGIPLLVWGQGDVRRLPAPAPYTRIAAADGPSIEYAIGYEVVRPSGRARRGDRNVPRPATHIAATIGFRLPDGEIHPLSGPEVGRRFPLEDGQQGSIRVHGAVIEVLAVGDDDSVRYRVIQSIPAQVEQITLQANNTMRWGAY